MPAAEPVFDDLYREVILDHYRRPRNRGRLGGATATAEGMNPVCGDNVVLDVRVEDGCIAALGFEGEGCSISLASASMLTQEVAGHTPSEAAAIADGVTGMLVEGREPGHELGDLAALEGVAQFPARVKCALLCWNVLRQALGEEMRDDPARRTR